MKPIRIFNRTLHKRLWYWLAEHPAKNKKEWIKEHSHMFTKEQLKKLYEQNHCFACCCADIFNDSSISNFKEICERCPLDWGIGKLCIELGSLYDIWTQIRDTDTASNYLNRMAKSYVANIIAELPIKEYDDIITIVI